MPSHFAWGDVFTLAVIAALAVGAVLYGVIGGRIAARRRPWLRPTDTD